MRFWSRGFSGPKRDRAAAAFALVRRLSDLEKLTATTLDNELPVFLGLLDGLEDNSKDQLLPLLLHELEHKSDRPTELETIAALARQPCLQSDKYMKILCKRAANASYALGDFKQASYYVSRLDSMPGLVTGPQLERVREELDAFARIRNAVVRASPDSTTKKSVNWRALYVLHNCLPFSSAGYAIRSHFILKEMRAAARGDEAGRVTAVARPGYPFDARRDPQVDLPSGAFRRDVDDVDYHFFGPSSRAGRVYSYILDASSQLAKRIGDDDINVVQAASNFYTAFPAMLSAREASIPFIYEVRSFWELTKSSRDDSYEGTLKYLRDTFLEDVLMAASDHIVTLTNAMKERIIERTGLPGLGVSVVPNCVDADFFFPRQRDNGLAARLGIGERDVVIGYIGSFVAYEGLPLLLEAFAGIRRDHENIKLLLVGGHPGDASDQGASLHKRALELGCAEAVVFAGRVPLQDVPRYYSVIDIAPFPRLSYPITELVSPLKPLEALAMAKCVLVSPVGGMTEQVIHGETGIILGEGLPGLEAGLRMMLQEPARRQQLGENARRWVSRERRWAQAAAQMKAIYTHVLADRDGMARRQHRDERIDYLKERFDRLADLTESSRLKNLAGKS